MLAKLSFRLSSLSGRFLRFSHCSLVRKKQKETCPKSEKNLQESSNLIVFF